MINESNIKELERIEKRGKLAEDLRLEHYKLQNELLGLIKGVNEIDKAYKLICNNGKTNYNFTCMDTKFASTKIKEILENEIELCKKNIKSLETRINDLINGERTDGQK